MRYPDFLKKGGTIGFIAPSFGCTIEPYKTLFDIAQKNFVNDGYKLSLGPNCYADNGIGISNTPDKCGEEVNDYFINDKSDVIISCGGGELMCEILPYVDFGKIQSSKPKWYMGYSDNTNLTFLLNTLCDIAAIYGPNAPKFGTDPMHKCVLDSYEVLRGERLSVSNYDGWYLEIDSPENEDNQTEDTDKSKCISHDEEIEEIIVEKAYEIVPYKQHIYMGGDVCDEAIFDGRLVGGCMDCLQKLIGTSFDRTKEFCERYKDDGIIWFLEACDFNVMDIRRALWQMENAGWFKYVKGFVVGRPMHFDDTFGEFGHIEAVRGILGKYNVPIVMDIDLGHLFPAMPIISGACATIHAAGNEIKIDYELR